ncbi:NADP-dependent oxidoreductase [Leptospira sp. GIMC2001]|uniref:NADP-dependent oxidoreductase n=1 Tax=Leptospira sp. GIMC2001 TaxID=1513297 RepID=UPI00234A8AA3|nr:NADP-dependent oxidoreductase [Leptospira sp. GIMC2001]WCL49633.1 NADP-dependent oxidoreductase [Leptospira sp. GIMC2001]
MGITNKKICLKSRAVGLANESNFYLKTEELPEIDKGQFLTKNLWLSIDPFLVGRIRDEKNYTETVPIDGMIPGYTISEVLESKNSEYPIGTLLFGYYGWQQYAIGSGSKNEQMQKVPKDLAPLSAWLGVLGVSGFTAYFGLYDLGKPMIGETVIISTAAGSVGSIVGQLAKLSGCRAVGITSSEEKCNILLNEYGFDAAVNYKDKDNLSSALKAACPNGADVYFDNVGGDLSDEVLKILNDHSRIIVCGRTSIAHLSDTSLDVGPRDHNALLVKRIKKMGYLALDYAPQFMKCTMIFAKLLKSGKIKYREDILEGIENAPEAFIRMMNGKNLGKQLVKIF